MTDATKAPNFEEMSDEQIMEYDPSELDESSMEEADPETGSAPDASEDAEPETPEETDGADHSEGPAEEESEEADADEEPSDDDTEDPAGEESPETPEDDQSEETSEEEESDEEPDSDDIDYKAAYQEIMAPLKAARREIQFENIADARRAMQMGVDYSRKMELMKPHLRVLRTLDKAGLTDPDKVNFLIDVYKKDPKAITQLLKDSDIDPMELDLKGGESYTPNEHVISDTELSLTEAFDSIAELPKYQDTLKVFESMDTASKQQLQDNPSVIPTIAQHMETGIYEAVWAKVEMERMMGRLPGLSDLDAYYKVGEALHKAGALSSPEDASSETSSSSQSAQGKGSPASSKPSGKKVKKDKRAAGPTKGSAAKGGKKIPDFSKMSDEQIMKVDISSLV